MSFNDKPLIDPANMPIWTASGFAVALLALVVALVAVYRTNVITVGTQLEVLSLNKKIDSQRNAAPAVVVPSQQAAPVAAATAK
jgi:hypothetical protein